MRYEVLQTIPTNLGRSVYIAVDDQGRRVLVKRGHTREWVDDLQRQARHFLTMAALLGEQSVYPEVLLLREGELIIPYYEYGTVDDLTLGDDKALVVHLTRRSLHYLFDIAAMQLADGRMPPERVSVAASYVVEEAEARLRRLQRAMMHTVYGVQWAHGRDAETGWSMGEIVADATAWISDGSLQTATAQLGPPALGLASHGDFDLTNVMLGAPLDPNARLVFIDTRGRWYGDFPWWDPVMDLATLIVFHCRIEPVIGRIAGGRPEGMRAPLRLSEREILYLCVQDPAFQLWIESDPSWYERLQVEIAIRLLGNISVQLLTAPGDQTERATAVLRQFLTQLPRTRAIIAGRREPYSQSPWIKLASAHEATDQ